MVLVKSFHVSDIFQSMVHFKDMVLSALKH